MSDLQIKTNHTDLEGAFTLPPSIRDLARAADPTVGLRLHITPAVATEWLETRGNNRKVSQSRVDLYAKDMKEGRWVFNGAPIQFDEDGKLLNGQHRLWAIIEAGFTMDAIVQWGIPREAQATIDAGQKWQLHDLLYMDGECNTHVLQATLRWLYRDETGSLLNSQGISNSQAKELLERHPGVRRSVQFVVGHKSTMAPSAAAYLHYKVSQLDEDKANEFFARLSDGVGLQETDPVYRLRERYAAFMGKGRMHKSEALAIAIIAWNYYYKGKELRQLRWVSSGTQAQPFPIIEGLPDQRYLMPKGTNKKSQHHAKLLRKNDKIDKKEAGERREVGLTMRTHRRN